MALQKTIEVETEVGSITVPDAYIRVHFVRSKKDWAEATVFFHKTAGDASVMTKHYGFVPDLNGGNIIQQSYLHLKTLSEFSNARDV